MRKYSYADSSKSKSQTATPVTLPEKPKKPLGSFLRFLQNVQPKLRAESPEVPQTDIVKAAGEIWKNFSDEQKAPYVAAYNKAAEAYVEAVSNYECSLTDEHKKLIERQKAAADRKALKKKMTELGKPPKPITSIALFVVASKNESKQYPKMKDFIRAMGAKWQSMTEDQKNEYRVKAKQYYDKYLSDLHRWEEDILKSADSSLEAVKREITRSRKRKEYRMSHPKNTEKTKGSRPKNTTTTV